MERLYIVSAFVGISESLAAASIGKWQLAIFCTSVSLIAAGAYLFYVVTREAK